MLAIGLIELVKIVAPKLEPMYTLVISAVNSQ